jgi:hypothetical protein
MSDLIYPADAQRTTKTRQKRITPLGRSGPFSSARSLGAGTETVLNPFLVLELRSVE